MARRFVRFALALALVGCKPKSNATPAADAAPPASAAASSSLPPPPPTHGTPSAASAPRTPAPPGECIEVDASDLSGGSVDLVGKITEGTRGHPNGTSFDFYLLTLPKPKCVSGLDEVKQVTEVQLAPDDPKQLARLVGKRARITGTAFPEHTAWHTRPVVISVETAKAL